MVQTSTLASFCSQGFTGEHCNTNEYVGSEISITPTQLLVDTFTTSATTTQLQITSAGSGILFVSMVTSSVPWATVFQNIPGDVPDFSAPIQSGASMRLGVQQSVQTTPGAGSYSGSLRIFSSDPNGAVVVPITLSVIPPALAIIALPQQLLSSLNPMESQVQTVTIWNVQIDPMRWIIDSCQCINNVCDIVDQPWLQVDRCTNTLEAQVSEVLRITLVAPMTVGQYAHTLDIIVPSKSSSWTISTSLRVYTSATHFSAAESRYEISWGDRSGPEAGSDFTVILHAADSHGNLIEAPCRSGDG
jgi:hypothetical protein